MGKRKLKASSLNGSREIAEFIVGKVEEGKDLAYLRQVFKPRALAQGLAAVSTHDRRSFEILVGPPGGDTPLLMDECLNFKLAVPLHKRFGPVSVAHFLGKKGKGDKAVLRLAAAHSAVVTYNGANERENDLVWIAERAYGDPDWAKRTRLSPAPGVIILPQGAKKAMQTLADNVSDIRAYLSRSPAQVLDLR